MIEAMTIELPGYSKDVERIIINHGFGKDDYGHLMINNYPNLQSIIVENGSFQKLKLLKICNCEQLKSIIIGNGDFNSVRNVNIESNYKCSNISDRSP